jgi:hypothetical protein
MTRSNIAAGVIGLLLAGSSIGVAIKNAQLREQLTAANATIRALNAGVFRVGSASPVLHQGLWLVPLQAGANDSQSSFRKKVSMKAECERCKTTAAPQKETAVASPGILPLSLLDIKHRYLPGDPDSDFTLFVFFSPTDCPGCLREAGVWQRLFQDRKTLHLSVIGIMNHCSQQEAEAARRELGITFPVLFDANSVLASSFGFQKTPEKILLNKQDQVILTSPSYQQEEMQRLFEHEIRQKCKRG